MMDIRTRCDMYVHGYACVYHVQHIRKHMYGTVHRKGNDNLV